MIDTILNPERDELILVPQRDFTGEHGVSLQEALLESVHSSPVTRRVVLDLSRVSHMDAMGLKLLLGLLKTCHLKGSTLEFVSAQPSVKALLEYCRLSRRLVPPGETSDG